VREASFLETPPAWGQHGGLLSSDQLDVEADSTRYILQMLLWLSYALASDLTCFWSKETPKAPRMLEVPLNGQTGNVLTIDWVIQGKSENPGDPAAFLTVRFQDGQEFQVRTILGQQASLTPTTTRDARPVLLADGTLATRQTIALGRAAPLEKLTIAARLPAPTLCMAGVQVTTEAVPLEFTTPTTGWYPWAAAHDFNNIPAAIPVVGPAGAKGFVRVDEQGNFVWPDGTRAKFWGTNLVGEAAIPEKEEAEAYATSLAALGFNLVRIHHIDRVARGILDAERGKPGHEDPFEDARLDRLDWFIAKLEEKGVHIWAEVATAREFSAADKVSDPEGAPNGHKLYPMWEKDWEEAYHTWFAQFWARTNPYTKKAYMEDPALVVLELSNEHALVNQWGAGLEQLAPSHLDSLQKRWNEWLKEKYKDDAALSAAWAGSVRPGLRAGESLSSGTVAREPAIPGIADRWPDQRRKDLLEFYWELERGFWDRLYAKAKSLGFKIPMIPTIQYNRPLLQAMHSDAVLTDIHVSYDKGGDGLISGQSILQNPGYLLNLLTVSTEGKAAAISELNHPHPNPYRAEAPWLWTTFASLQSVDVLIWSSWAEGFYSEDPSLQPHRSDLRTSPLLLAQLPAASAAFRGGWIPEASGFFPVNLQEAAVRAWQGQLEPPKALELLSLNTLISDAVRTMLGAPKMPSPGKPVAGVGWWSDPGVLYLDQPEVQVRAGFPGSVSVGSGPGGAGITATSRLQTSLSSFAVVALTSADGQPLSSSQKAWLTIVGQAENTGQSWTAFGSSLRAPGTGPILMEPLSGTVSFQWTGTPVVERLGPDAKPLGEVPVKGKKGWWTLETSELKTPWLLVRSRE
jgi:hypothetical protein